MILCVVRENDNDDIQSNNSRSHTRKQFPLRLSWAVTVHKAQGLTEDELVVGMSQYQVSWELVLTALMSTGVLVVLVLMVPRVLVALVLVVLKVLVALVLIVLKVLAVLVLIVLVLLGIERYWAWRHWFWKYWYWYWSIDRNRSSLLTYKDIWRYQ